MWNCQDLLIGCEGREREDFRRTSGWAQELRWGGGWGVCVGAGVGGGGGGVGGGWHSLSRKPGAEESLGGKTRPSVGIKGCQPGEDNPDTQVVVFSQQGLRVPGARWKCPGQRWELGGLGLRAAGRPQSWPASRGEESASKDRAGVDARTSAAPAQ